MKRSISLAVASCALLLAGLTLPSGALGTGTVTVVGDTITFAQTGGSARPALSYNVMGAYVFEDTNGLTASTGCSQVSSTEVSCASSFPRQVTFDSPADVDASVPAGGRVSLVRTSNSPNAVVPIVATDVTTSIHTGSGADVITGGDPDLTGVISTGGSSDSITIYTDLPQVSMPRDEFEQGDPGPSGYPVSTNVFEGEEDFWPLKISSGVGGDYIDASDSEGGVYYEYGDGCDLFLGGDGDDYAYHGAGTGAGTDDDTYVMGAGDDEIWAYDGNLGDDMTYGGSGDDRYLQTVNLAEEMFDGGPGWDRVQINSWGSWASNTGQYNMTLDGVRDDGPEGNDIFTSTVEWISSKSISGRSVNMVGNAENNTLIGTSGADVMTGGPGVDTIGGAAGDDTIYAHDGVADNVVCSTGTDTVEADAIDTLSGCENITTY